MSLLDPAANSGAPTKEQRIIRQTNQLKMVPRRMADQLISGWESSFDLLWGNQGEVTPAERIEALGTDAAELFASSGALVSFVIPLLSGKDDDTVARITAKVAAMPAITAHPDGTVTLEK